MVKLHQIRDGLEAWLQWTIVTGISWTVCFLAFTGFAGSIGFEYPDWWLLGLVSGSAGAIVGFAQWLVSPLDIQSLPRWVLASAAGWAVGILLTTAITGSSSVTSGWKVAGFAGGLVCGLIQVLAVSTRSASRTLWPVMSAGGWAASYGLGELAVGTPPVQPEMLGAASTSLGGIVGWTSMALFAALLLGILVPKAHQKNIDGRDRWFI